MSHHLLVAETMWDLMSEKQAQEHLGRVFECGACSSPEVTVYYNLLGQHCHVLPVERDKMVAQVLSAR